MRLVPRAIGGAGGSARRSRAPLASGQRRGSDELDLMLGRLEMGVIDVLPSPVVAPHEISSRSVALCRTADHRNQVATTHRDGGYRRRDRFVVQRLIPNSQASGHEAVVAPYGISSRSVALCRTADHRNQVATAHRDGGYRRRGRFVVQRRTAVTSPILPDYVPVPRASLGPAVKRPGLLRRRGGAEPVLDHRRRLLPGVPDGPRARSSGPS
jgi:hypothetical protein